jgi:aryl-alcohol dehydrogenase-like predicted oxidoreductase
MTLERAHLGNNGPDITRLGLGAWAIGGGEWDFGWGPQDDQDSVDTIKHGVESGLSWVDTAAAYGLGHGEEVVGRAVHELPEPDRPYVFTKNGMVWEEGDTGARRIWAPDLLKRDAERSLKRLGVDRIDLLQIHWPGTDDASVEEAWGAMAELQDEGKVRWIGASNFGTDLLDRCEAVRHVDSVQPPLSLIARQAAGVQRTGAVEEPGARRAPDRARRGARRHPPGAGCRVDARGARRDRGDRRREATGPDRRLDRRRRPPAR